MTGGLNQAAVKCTLHVQEAIAFFPRLRARFGRGTHSPGQTMSSKSSGSLANPNRIAGARLSSPTNTKLWTARKIVRYFVNIAGLC